MSHYTFSIHVAAPPEKVFDLWQNLERMHEWTEGVTKISDMSGPMAVGARYTVWFGRTASPTEVLEFDRPRRLRTSFGSWLEAL
jgi:uncharacterized protein YndB with AHSA1/START domain